MLPEVIEIHRHTVKMLQSELEGAGLDSGTQVLGQRCINTVINSERVRLSSQ